MVVSRFGLGAAVIAGLLVLVASGRAYSEDKPGKDAPDAAKATDEAPDRYAVPDGDVKELLAFIKGLNAFKPTTREELRQHQLKKMAAVKAAAEKIKETATEADQSLEGYTNAVDVLLYFRAREAARGAEDAELKALVKEIKTSLERPEPSEYAVNSAIQLCTGLEFGSPESQGRAAAAYSELGPVLAKSANKRTAGIGAKMEGAARRLNLLGQPMQITGTPLTADAKFDWAAYRGKVVLVDFWATWCGPCVAELPNVKKNYELYHDKGFDIVGISLDHDRSRLETFIKEREIPWTTLYDNEDGDTPSASYYGVMGIPTVILVDKEGKVVSTNARGPQLGKLLADLLGPAEPAEPEGEAKAGDDKSSK
jgi:thiol-disulfide isomerase/thioredoxin